MFLKFIIEYAYYYKTGLHDKPYAPLLHIIIVYDCRWRHNLYYLHEDQMPALQRQYIAQALSIHIPKRPTHTWGPIDVSHGLWCQHRMRSLHRRRPFVCFGRLDEICFLSKSEVFFAKKLLLAIRWV